MAADCSIRPLICRSAGEKNSNGCATVHTLIFCGFTVWAAFQFPTRVNQVNRERGTIVPQDAERRILAEEAAQENNPKTLIEIIEALNRALNEQEQHKKKAVSTSQ